jgi:hypothetical protein
MACMASWIAWAVGESVGNASGCPQLAHFPECPAAESLKFDDLPHAEQGTVIMNKSFLSGVFMGLEYSRCAIRQGPVSEPSSPALRAAA